MPNVAAMLEVCRRYTGAAPGKLFVPEPYIPFIPNDWNGLLVLAEAQNLSDPEGDYEKWLEQQNSDMRFKRLGDFRPDTIGIGPWDDGCIKLMVKSIASGIDISRVAVSNAVPWSCQYKGKNVRPTDEAIAIATKFWRELLAVLGADLKCIVCFGKIAEWVVGKSSFDSGRVLRLRLPSPRPGNYMHSMFLGNDFLKRYPEVDLAAKKLGMLERLQGEESGTKGMVLFACHAVSKGKEFMEGSL